jgi:NTE family protein
LQGGGAHGAFTWGVLDHLLEDGRLDFDGISGTSAGAMNAVALAHGWSRAGATARARRWKNSGPRSRAACRLPTPRAVRMGAPSPSGRRSQHARLGQPVVSRQLNPFDLNPLRDIDQRADRFRAPARARGMKLFVATTNANSGQLRLFRLAELTADVILASACLPTIHRAVEIDGEPYWDGGYAANPAVFPLFYECHSHDIMLVLLSPLKYHSTPHTAKDIRERMLEFAFTATFLREMRMFAHLRDYVRKSWIPLGRFERRIANTHFHVIDAQDFMRELAADSKLAANMKFFTTLKELGRERARAWLQEHFAQVGRASSVEIADLFY